MQYRQLGNTDLNVSVIGLGTNNFGNPSRIADKKISQRVIDKCIDLGINFLDTANIYGNGESEIHIGEALKGKRNDVLIATKFNLTNLNGESPKSRIQKNIEESLRKLQTDVIDLYQIHFVPNDIPHEEYLEPLNELIVEGKVRHLGECNYSSWRHADTTRIADSHGWSNFVSSQNNYSLMHRHAELELLPYCTEHKVGFLPYFPLAGGWLTGKYASGNEVPQSARRMVGQLQNDSASQSVLGKLDAFASEHEKTLVDLAFAWLLAHPAVSSVIAGAMTEEQVISNANAANWILDREQRDQVDEIAYWEGSDEDIERFGMGPDVPSAPPR
ncbi:MAG: aldo/keto reductase [Chloroflexi bacterium]|jgi:aryl-alcohol dehydrogenase-like predicted oxidoreductase|nr:aldo/keto reductase [Chloroflexota bacterium]MCH2531667.1 aldo/keto reductase [Dehalococcoidia bacterium]|tara:strand:+ start:189 stop:1178 length:990 start_codon:yes stop_codon:yes gene_type:complete